MPPPAAVVAAGVTSPSSPGDPPMSGLVPPSPPAPVAYRNRWAFPVPWDRASEVRARLVRHGFPSTLCVNAADRMAHLEPWPGVPAQPFAVALVECLRFNAFGRQVA